MAKLGGYSFVRVWVDWVAIHRGLEVDHVRCIYCDIITIIIIIIFIRFIKK